MATATSVADPAWRIFKELNLITQEWVPTWVQAGHKQGLSGINACLFCPLGKQTAQSRANRVKDLLGPVEFGARSTETRRTEPWERRGGQY